MNHGPTDTCPRCLHQAVTPTVDTEDYSGNPHTAYKCPACHHVWTTRRLAAPETPTYATYDDPDAWEAHDTYATYDRRFDDADQAAAERRQQDREMADYDYGW